jgi:hypothetical protein
MLPCVGTEEVSAWVSTSSTILCGLGQMRIIVVSTTSQISLYSIELPVSVSSVRANRHWPLHSALSLIRFLRWRGFGYSRFTTLR